MCFTKIIASQICSPSDFPLHVKSLKTDSFNNIWWLFNMIYESFPRLEFTQPGRTISLVQRLLSCSTFYRFFEIRIDEVSRKDWWREISPPAFVNSEWNSHLINFFCSDLKSTNPKSSPLILRTLERCE